MNYLSGYIQTEQAACTDSVLLQQAGKGADCFLLACVSDNNCDLEDGETAGGYSTRRLFQWFYDRGIPLCDKRMEDYHMEKELTDLWKGVREELNCFGQRKGRQIPNTITGILISDARFWIMHSGSGRIYLLNQSYHRSHIKCLTGITQDREPLIVGGSLQSGLGLLLCTPGWYHMVSEEQMKECLNVREITRELQIGKRLKELTGEGAGGSAVFIKV